MDINALVEQFARMSIQERNEWPHLATEISNLIIMYGMINETKEPVT